jgi:hypothetical protein
MRIPNTQSASCHAEAITLHKNAVVRAYNLLHDDTRSAFMELSSSCEDDYNDNADYDDNDDVVKGRLKHQEGYMIPIPSV